jgi:hypothetical protein
MRALGGLNRAWRALSYLQGSFSAHLHAYHVYRDVTLNYLLLMKLCSYMFVLLLWYHHEMENPCDHLTDEREL